MANQSIGSAIAVGLDQVTEAMRLLFSKAKIVAEGAGAASLAAALRSEQATGNVVCVISGGNIDAGVYAQILGGAMPEA